MKEQALGLFARTCCFKLRAGSLKGFANHRFCEAGQNRSGGDCRMDECGPAEFSHPGRICPLRPANNSSLIQRPPKETPDLRAFPWFTAEQDRVNGSKRKRERERRSGP